MSKGSRRDWSTLDDEVLRTLHGNGHGVSYIACFMLRGRATIHARARALGLDFKEPHYWTQAEDAVLRIRYPDETAAAIAGDLGLDVSQVHRRANHLGLRKSDAFLASDKSARIQRGRRDPRMAAHKFQKGHVPANKGLRRPGWSPGRMRETQFKKGRPAHEARNYVPIGTEKVCPKRNVLMRKVTDDPSLAPVKRWRPVHVLVWEAAHGPVLPGHIVVFKPGQKTYRADEITVDRLDAVTLAEHMRRNTIHNLPPELVRVVQLRGAIVRQINRKEKKRGND